MKDSTEEPGIEAASLCVSYRGESGTIVAIDNLSFTLRPRRLGVVVGPSGCGKTTLLLALSGLLDKRAIESVLGQISMLGQPSRVLRESRGLALSFQSPSLLPWLSVEGNVLLPTKLGKRASFSSNELPIDSLLARLGLEKCRHYLPAALSGGMAQRVSLARALVLQPRVLMLDEPFAHLDYPTWLRLLSLVRGIHIEWGLTTLMVTHNLREAACVADDVFIMGPPPQNCMEPFRIRKTEEEVRSASLLNAEIASRIEGALLEGLNRTTSC